MAEINEDSILDTIKNIVGIPSDITDFDVPIKASINGAIVTLGQLGVGPSAGFIVTSKDDVWTSITDDITQLPLIKNYISLKTTLIFDAPTNAFLVTAIKEQIQEIEFRLNTNAEGDFDAE